jgi:hypothetical protein
MAKGLELPKRREIAQSGEICFRIYFATVRRFEKIFCWMLIYASILFYPATTYAYFLWTRGKNVQAEEEGEDGASNERSPLLSESAA